MGLLDRALVGAQKPPLAATWPGPLLAKELAGIDGVSGGRLTLGLGVGQRPDDFIPEGYGPTGRGTRMDRDLETYRDIWRGEPVGGGPNPAVPPETRVRRGPGRVAAGWTRGRAAAGRPGVLRSRRQ